MNQQWSSESMNHEAMQEWRSMIECSPWINESRKQRNNKSMKQPTSEPMNRGINDSVDQWINESTNHWTNARGDGWMYEWTDGRATLLCWAISSLRHLFSQLLLWAATYLNTSALNCLPAGSFVASATQLFSSHSYYNAFSSLQLQSRIASTRAALWLKLPYLPKVLRSCDFFFDFEVQIEFSLLFTSCRHLSQPGETETLLQRPREPLYSKKHRVPGQECCFHLWIQCFRTVTRPNCVMMSGWHNDVVNMMVGMLTMNIARNWGVF